MNIRGGVDGVKKNLQFILIICVLLLCFLIVFLYANKTVYLEGTINKNDNRLVVTFNSFEAGSPSELFLPNNYVYPVGSRVVCKIRYTDVFEIRYFKILSIDKAEKIDH